MTGKDDRTEQAAELRRQAEVASWEDAARPPEDLDALSPEAARHALHELRVHQIELEIQNEELRRTQMELDAARARYFDLYDLAPVGYVTVGEQGVIREANLTAATLLGEARGALVARPISRFIHREDQDVFYRHRKQLVETGEPQMCELRLLRHDGSAFWAHVEANIAQDDGGESVLRIVLSDITERKQAEASLLESEQRHRRFYESGMLGVLYWDVDGQIIDANDKFLEMVGYSRAELENGGIDWINMTPPEYRYLDQASIEELKTTGVNSAPFEKEYIRKDLSRMPILLAGAMVDAERLKGVAFILDITERKQAERLLHLQADVLTTVNAPALPLETVRDVVATIKRATGFDAVGVRLHEADDYPFLAAEGYSDEFLQAENTLTIRYPDGGLCRDEDGAVSLECTCGLVLGGRTDPANPLFSAGGSAWTNDALPLLNVPLEDDPRLHPRNRCIHVGFQSIALIPLRSGDQILGLLHLADRKKGRFSPESICFFEGIGCSIGMALLRRQTEEEIRRLNTELEQRVAERTAELEAANQELQAFSYSIAHDLRAPLRAMEGFSSAVLSGYAEQLDDQGRHYLERIQEASRRMGQLIGDLLDLSRITRGELTLTQVDLAALAREITAELGARDPCRQVQVVIAGPLPVRGDARLLRIVLQNLLDNAWKFSGPRERATIEVGRLDPAEPPDPRGPVYFVRDNGVGFDMAHADQLFSPFQRLHAAHEFPGTGIGLAIVQRIIARHGGRVWADAQPDAGATFYFTLGGKA